MDSKGVDAVLREVFWPALKAHGFARRTGRTAWRDQGACLGVANVQSFNSYLAEGLGATTFSFCVNLGVFYPAIEDRLPLGPGDFDPTRPAESRCHARRHLTKGFAQPPRPARSGLRLWRRGASRDPWRDRPDVWLVLPDGSNVREAVADATERVLAEGLPWLDALADPREALRRFREVPDAAVPFGGVTEFYGGSLGSPMRLKAIAGIAAGIGDMDELASTIEAMSANPYWLDRAEELVRLRDELALAKA